jgi:hypothetical protein
VNIIYKGVVQQSVVLRGPIKYAIYLLYVWWEIDPILVLIVQQTLIHPPSQQIFVAIIAYKAKGCVIY